MRLLTSAHNSAPAATTASTIQNSLLFSMPLLILRKLNQPATLTMIPAVVIAHLLSDCAEQDNTELDALRAREGIL
jgi:hypothetical protein